MSSPFINWQNGSIGDTGRKLTRVIHVSCLNFKQENLRGDYHGYIGQDTADVLPWASVNQWNLTENKSATEHDKKSSCEYPRRVPLNIEEPEASQTDAVWVQTVQLTWSLLSRAMVENPACGLCGHHHRRCAWAGAGAVYLMADKRLGSRERWK